MKDSGLCYITLEDDFTQQWQLSHHGIFQLLDKNQDHIPTECSSGHFLDYSHGRFLQLTMT